MTAWTGGSFTPTSNDGSQGVRSGLLRLDTASNGIGLSTAPGVSSYTGATVYNRSATNWVRARANYVAGFIPAFGLNIYQLVPPQGVASFSFGGADVIDSIQAQVIDTPLTGVTTMADVATVSAAVIGTVDVTVNLVNG